MSKDETKCETQRSDGPMVGLTINAPKVLAKGRDKEQLPTPSEARKDCEAVPTPSPHADSTPRE